MGVLASPRISARQINKKMIFITQCDSPALWQTYLSDPASISMEGILIFNKHLLFLLTVIVLFIG